MKTLDLITTTDWNTEIIEDSSNPAFHQVWDIKSRVMLCLTDWEQMDYESMRTRKEQTEFIKKKAIEFYTNK